MSSEPLLLPPNKERRSANHAPRLGYDLSPTGLPAPVAWPPEPVFALPPIPLSPSAPMLAPPWFALTLALPALTLARPWFALTLALPALMLAPPRSALTLALPALTLAPPWFALTLVLPALTLAPPWFALTLVLPALTLAPPRSALTLAPPALTLPPPPALTLTPPMLTLAPWFDWLPAAASVGYASASEATPPLRTIDKNGALFTVSLLHWAAPGATTG